MPPAASDRPLSAALHERGLDVRMCATACEVSVAVIYAWDAGTRRPTDEHASRLGMLIGAPAVLDLLARKVADPVATRRRVTRALGRVIAECQRRGAAPLAREIAREFGLESA